jgi:hypothetical protein
LWQLKTLFNGTVATVPTECGNHSSIGATVLLQRCSFTLKTL